MAPIRAATPGAGSYVNEGDFFEPNWREEFWGRADRQGANRDQMGSEAPLPVGRYRLGAIEPLGPRDPKELGPIWIGIEPEFSTGRRVLGIHLDPSAGRNWNSGTAGCIGLIRSNDMVALAELVRRSGTNTLVVAQ